MQRVRHRQRLNTTEPVIAVYGGTIFRPNRAAWNLLGQVPTYLTVYTDGSFLALSPDDDPEGYKVSRPDRDGFIQSRALGLALGLIDTNGVAREPRTRYIPVYLEEGCLVGRLPTPESS